MPVRAHKLLERDEVLDNELRGRVMEHLVRSPGSYLGKISRELSVPTSTLKYHLNILRSFEMVTTVKKGRCRHYFPRRRRFSDEEKAMYAALEHAPTRRMIEIVHRNPGISQRGLVRATGLSQSTVAWHMAKLEEIGLVASEKRDVKAYSIAPAFVPMLHQVELARRVEAAERQVELERLVAPPEAPAPVLEPPPPEPTFGVQV